HLVQQLVERNLDGAPEPSLARGGKEMTGQLQFAGEAGQKAAIRVGLDRILLHREGPSSAATTNIRTGQVEWIGKCLASTDQTCWAVVLRTPWSRASNDCISLDLARPMAPEAQ